jgi:long-chain acyl-CoA synthetase
MYAELAQVRAELCGSGQPFEIEEIEVRGVVVKAWRNAAPSLRDLWLQSAAHADQDYLVYGEDRWTFAEAHEEVARIARWLSDHGIGQHDRVAIAMRNYPEWMLSYWAVLSLGAVVVGVNAWWVPEELSYGLKDAAPKLMICDAERLQRFEAIRSELPEMQIVAVRCEEPLPQHAVPWSEVLKAAAELPEAEIDPDDDACIFYTSGTTGHPKGARLTHRGCTNNVMSALFANMSQTVAMSRVSGEEAPATVKSATLLTTPLFHVTANNVIAQTNTLLGNKLVHMYKWDAAEAIRIIEREKITSMSGVPVMAREVLSHPDYAKADTSSLVSLGGGGAALQPDLVKKISDSSGATPGSAFGMTEVCGLATGISGAYFHDRPDSVGPVLPVFDVKCIDTNGKALAVGERGEILLKGAQVIKGYLNRDDATAETIVDGWLHSGDIGYLDEDGFLYIVDRIKDMVLRGGENIYCAEVEAALFKYPGVSEAVVFAVPDDHLGEEVGAAIYAENGETISVPDLRAYCKEHLSAYKIPRYVWLQEQPLPRNASGKFLKKELRGSLEVKDAV